MRLFGLTITRSKATAPASLSPPYNGRGGWWPVVREGFAGAWQRGIEWRREDVLTFAAVYACVRLISSDVGKLRIKLVEQGPGGIWVEVDNAAHSPFLRKPNHFQNRIKFFEQWIISKLIHGNTYVLKVRDKRNVVVAGYILDPTRVQVLVAPNGDVYYALHQDNLAGLEEARAVVPASEIMHDVMVPLYHPLCGVTPISACGLAASQGLSVQKNSASFFANGSQPGGLLVAPGTITVEEAKNLRALWEEQYGGENSGRVGVLGNGLKYEPMAINAVDSQLIDQLKWTAENVCTAFGVPPYMIGVAPPPTYTNIEALTVQYYTQCLQTHIESIELLLDEGLGLTGGASPQRGTEFDLDQLMRMDTASRTKAASEALGSGAMAPNEARQRYFELPPVTGGDTPYLQQQNYSLAALHQRDQSADPFSKGQPSPAAAPSQPPPPPSASAKRFEDYLRKECA